MITLIDSGSSHNVIRQELVDELKCETKTVAAYMVTLADGKKVRGDRMCKKVKWRARKVDFEIDDLILPLGEYDVILGMQWLDSLGKLTWDFGERKLQFNVDDKEMELQVMPKPVIHWMSKE